MLRRSILHAAALLVALLAATAGAAGAAGVPRLGPYKGVKADLRAAAARLGVDERDLLLAAAPATPPNATALRSRCRLTWRTATLDHFGWGHRVRRAGPANTWKQRVFVCDDAWRKAGAPAAPTVFFYAANEANAELYLNHTGAMWENAEAFSAILVFPEHRFYGESTPFGRGAAGTPRRLRYLSAEQALADYAQLIGELRDGLPGGQDSAVIAFGGSYGGMLATWLRQKYPHAVDGAVAGSAPIWAFEGVDPPVDGGAFARIVAADAGAPGGSHPDCAANVRAAWAALADAVGGGGGGGGGGQGGGAAAPRPRPRPAAKAAHAALRLCPEVELDTPQAAASVAEWFAGAFDYLAMGDYPYPSSYITNGDGVLPAYPMRVACERATERGRVSGLDALRALASAAGVFYNFSGLLPCFDPGAASASASTDDDGWLWGYQACTEMTMPMWRDGVADLGPAAAWSEAAFAAACEEQYGVRPRPLWATTEWGGRRLAGLTNVVWTNGDLDPWSGTGVTAASAAAGGARLARSAVALPVPGGAHHLDLMFSTPDDPPAVVAARDTTRAHMRRWVAEVRARGGGGGGAAVVATA